LKKGDKFIWDEKYQKDLANIKWYLTNTLVLSPYDLDKSLLLYLLATLSTLGEMLAQKDENYKERKIYYVNKIYSNRKYVFCNSFLK